MEAFYWYLPYCVSISRYSQFIPIKRCSGATRQVGPSFVPRGAHSPLTSNRIRIGIGIDCSDTSWCCRCQLAIVCHSLFLFATPETVTPVLWKGISELKLEPCSLRRYHSCLHLLLIPSVSASALQINLIFDINLLLVL
jgi:hypothetical protein